MAYDQKLADRTRRLIGDDPELTEKKMFGGLASQPRRGGRRVECQPLA